MSYWFVCACLLVFGFLAGFSIGLPFFHVGLAMLLLGPFRAHRFVFWPLLLAVIGYEVGFIAVAPFSCSATQQIGENVDDCVPEPDRPSLRRRGHLQPFAGAGHGHRSCRRGSYGHRHLAHPEVKAVDTARLITALHELTIRVTLSRLVRCSAHERRAPSLSTVPVTCLRP